MGVIIKAVTDFVQANALVIALYVAFSIVAIPIMVSDRIKRRNRYIWLKKETINLGFFSREYERTSDEFMQQLLDDNIRLEAENKALRKQYSRLSLIVFVSVLIGLVIVWVSYNAKSVLNWIRAQLPKSPTKDESASNE